MSSPIVRNSTVRSHYESVERVIVAMRSQIDQPFSLGSMARIALASRYHFNRTFRQVTGVPPAQFLYALRLERAKRLLVQTQKKVIDICYGVGYNSVGTFTRRFTDMLGISPKAFRELSRRPQSQAPQPQVTQARHAEDRRAPEPPAVLHAPENPRTGCCVSGFVSAPARFNGLIFVGLFETPIPQGKPLACAIVSKSGHYQFDASQGEYYLFALGLEDP